ncbi:MAG TPA: hypothetical protein PLN26_12810 [Acidobacteriota bacterium]|nr:hypothetical protein [Acidobacteriota bacterium]
MSDDQLFDQLFRTCEPVRIERLPECDPMILEDAHPIHQTGRMLPIRRTDWKFESMGDSSIVQGTTIPALTGRDFCPSCDVIE